MRRNYRSKKDVTSGLDPKEMFHTLDDKSSAFDAFYISNIKQTKRELSCIGASNHHGIASNRVRKRKYVKRVVKDVEQNTRESLSESVFLTPDKSIRVNKALDPFDLLLNSSPAAIETKQAKKESLFDHLFEKMPPSRTYTRKKPVRVSKIKYSSSDSTDSDKENDTSSVIPQDITDIHSHELVIEKECKTIPKMDESLTNIVKNLSLLSHLKKQNMGSIKKTYKHRLTKNLVSPLLQNSPLSSTPFTEKNRSKSIYKFSPIPMADLEESPNYVTINDNSEVVNESVVFLPKSNKYYNNAESPISHLTSKTNKLKVNSKDLFSSEETSSHTSKESAAGSVTKEVPCTVSNENISCIDLSSFITSEVEPFKGFSVKESSIQDNDDETQDSIDQEGNSSIVFSIGLSKTSKDKIVLPNHNTSETIDNSINSKPPNGSLHEKQKLREDSLNIHEIEDNYLIEGKEESMDNGNTSKLTSISKEFLGFSCVENADMAEEENFSEDNIDENDTETDDTINSQDNERESSYDTCDSHTSSIKSHKEPVVSIEKMNDSLFNKYYDKAMCDSPRETDSNKSTEDYESFDNSLNFTNSEHFMGEIPDNDDTTSLHSEENNLKSCSENSNEEEDKVISFVTTRRRHEIANNSTILGLDDSNSSINTEFDKTVLSNYELNVRNAEDSIINNDITLPNEIRNSSGREAKTELVSHFNNTDTINMRRSKAHRNSIFDTEESSITVRKSRMVRESSVPRVTDLGRPGIVLQPGKKWERSLSIYKRMTMASDKDSSILDDEDLNHKGRKYRHSVISTMELQEGLLHNESIHSHRSSFISKPNRSTIRIVKETNNSRISLNSTTLCEDFQGFLEVCDDTVVELSKLSIVEDHNITVLDKFHDRSRVATARDYVLRRCNQSDGIQFDECYPDTVLKNCRKIGEGVYGEVFLYRASDGRARVMKIVPIAGTTKVNGEHQKDFHEIISEIVIAMELSALRAPIANIERNFDEGKDTDALDLHSIGNATDIFNEVLAVRCVYGSYPSRLLDLWELYDECSGSENDNPAVLPVDQQYIVLELANAGQDLESYQFNGAEQAHALFWQPLSQVHDWPVWMVAFGLAVGEEAFQFEHRDLHWGNVLIAPTDQKFATFILRGRRHTVPRAGVAATIIDYSLSRLALPLSSRPDRQDRPDVAALYNDLATDDSLFTAVGDYQFEVYRLMREKLGNDWQSFEPYTNILWLHYTADKMITALRYKRPHTKTHKHFLAKLTGIKERILTYRSATDFVLTDNEY